MRHHRAAAVGGILLVIVLAACGSAGSAQFRNVGNQLAGIRSLEKPNIAALSVALRTLRSVVRQGG